MSFLNKLVSGITAAPRALGSLVTGNIKDFKLIDSKQSVGKSLTQSYLGTLTAGATTAGAGLLVGAATPLVSKLVKSNPSKPSSSLVSKLTGGVQRLIPSVIKSGLPSFSQPLTGLQREVFGAPPSNRVDVPKQVSYQAAGLDNFNASAGDISVSTEKKMPGWVVPVVSIGLAVIAFLISMFSRKRR